MGATCVPVCVAYRRCCHTLCCRVHAASQRVPGERNGPQFTEPRNPHQTESARAETDAGVIVSGAPQFTSSAALTRLLYHMPAATAATATNTATVMPAMSAVFALPCGAPRLHTCKVLKAMLHVQEGRVHGKGDYRHGTTCVDVRICEWCVSAAQPACAEKAIEFGGKVWQQAGVRTDEASCAAAAAQGLQTQM